MNKSELVKTISEKSGSTIKDSEKFLDSFVETITEAMKKTMMSRQLDLVRFLSLKEQKELVAILGLERISKFLHRNP